MNLDISDALSLFANHRDAIIMMWSFYSAATIAVVGFILGSKNLIDDFYATWTVAVGFTIFTLGNGYTVFVSQQELQQLSYLVHRLAKYQNISELLIIEPIKPYLFAIFHLAIFGTVLFLLVHRGKWER